MSNTQHTPEPWNNSNSWIYTKHSIGVFDTNEDGQRCVDCVNAMAGIDDPQAFRDSVDKLNEYVHQVDDILFSERKRSEQLYQMCENLWQTLNAVRMNMPLSLGAEACAMIAITLKENNPSKLKSND